jgi:hypothetical protein
VANGFGESTMKARLMNNRDVGFLLAWDFSFFPFLVFVWFFFHGLVCVWFLDGPVEKCG